MLTSSCVSFLIHSPRAIMPVSSKAIFCSFIAVSICCFFTTDSRAQTVVFDNGVGAAANVDDALQSDADPLPENNNSVEIAADDFFVTADTEITTVEWFGLYAISNTPAVDDFVIRIYADTDGPSGSPIATFNVGNDVNRNNTGVTFMFLLDVFQYSADISFAAAANTTYWLSIDAQSFADNNDTWFWGTNSLAGNTHTSSDIGNTWTPFGQTTSMVLSGVETMNNIPGDINCDGEVNLLDVQPFVDLISTGGFLDKADLNKDGAVDLLDVDPFVALLAGA